MLTYKELKQFIEANNVRFELIPVTTEYDSMDLVDGKIKFVKSEMVVGYDIALNNIAGRTGRSEWQWVWFHCTDDNLKDDSHFWFTQRYSQVNGKSYKGISEDIKAIETIRRRMN